MTLVIATATPDGVVLTADSRQTYVNRSQMPRIASDNAVKIVRFNERTAIATAGQAFFADAGKLKSIQAWLEEFRSTASQNFTTSLDVAQALQAAMETWLLPMVTTAITDTVKNEKGSELKIGVPKDGKIPYEFKDAAGKAQSKEWFGSWVSFVVAGRDPDGSCHAINVFPFYPITVHSTSDAPGIQWIGQTEVLVKLLTGNDAFVISTGTMTIQDAIDFSVLLIRTTENIQKFSDGTLSSQGGIPGVGGPIDVVFVPRKEGELQWLSEKKLQVKEPGS